jgi:hypothetical protein
MQTTKLWATHLQHLKRYRQEEAGKPRSSELPTGWHHPSREQKIEGKLCREDHATTAHVRCGVARIVWRGSSSTRHVHRDPLNRSLSPNPTDWMSSPALTWTSRDEQPSVQSALHYKIHEGAQDGLSLISIHSINCVEPETISRCPALRSSMSSLKVGVRLLFWSTKYRNSVQAVWCFWRKIPKGDTESKFWRQFSFSRNKSPNFESPATCLFSGYSFNGIVQSCCPIKWKSVRGDATVAALQNWKKQKKHLYKLFSGVSFNHEEPGKADVHDFSFV